MVKTLTRICNNRTMIVRKNTGRGVMAMTTFQAGEVIERVPVIVEQGLPDEYLIRWGANVAMPLGHCALANKSASPNAAIAVHLEECFVDFTALKNIFPGEEITVSPYM